MSVDILVLLLLILLFSLILFFFPNSNVVVFYIALAVSLAIGNSSCLLPVFIFHCYRYLRWSSLSPELDLLLIKNITIVLFCILLIPYGCDIVTYAISLYPILE